MLFALMLLLLLFVLACPGGGLDRREPCRFTVPTKGSAPGTVSSVSPAREFGAFATKSGVWGRAERGELREGCLPCDGGVHVQLGECLRAIESMLGPRGVCGDDTPTIGRFCSRVFRHDSISSSLIGVTPPSRKGAFPLLYRHVRHIATKIRRIPTTPRTEESMMIKFRC